MEGIQRDFGLHKEWRKWGANKGPQLIFCPGAGLIQSCMYLYFPRSYYVIYSTCNTTSYISPVYSQNVNININAYMHDKILKLKLLTHLYSTVVTDHWSVKKVRGEYLNSSSHFNV